MGVSAAELSHSSSLSRSFQAAREARRQQSWTQIQREVIERSLKRLKRDTGVEAMIEDVSSDGGRAWVGERGGNDDRGYDDTEGGGHLRIVRESLGVEVEVDLGQRISLNTISSPGLTPRAGEVAWWSRGSVGSTV